LTDLTVFTAAGALMVVLTLVGAVFDAAAPAASAGPASSEVASSTAANFLNMVVSLLLLRRASPETRADHSEITTRALNSL
jgi:hypothetical protein